MRETIVKDELSPNEFLKDRNKESALRLLEKNGYKEYVKIPDPVSQNILPDRIYFLVKVSSKWKPRTAFIKAALDEDSVELEIFRGWLITHP